MIIFIFLTERSNDDFLCASMGAGDFRVLSVFILIVLHFSLLFVPPFCVLQMADFLREGCAVDGCQIFVTNDSVRKGMNDLRHKQGGNAVFAGQNRANAKISVWLNICVFFILSTKEQEIVCS
jgi:hypothetical protein